MYYMYLSNDIREYYNEKGFDYEKFEDEEGLNSLIELHNKVIIDNYLDYGLLKSMYELDNDFIRRTATEILDIFKNAGDYGRIDQSFNTQRDYYYENSNFEYVSVDQDNLILALKDLDILTDFKDYIIGEY